MSCGGDDRRASSNVVALAGARGATLPTNQRFSPLSARASLAPSLSDDSANALLGLRGGGTVDGSNGWGRPSTCSGRGSDVMLQVGPERFTGRFAGALSPVRRRPPPAHREQRGMGCSRNS